MYNRTVKYLWIFFGVLLICIAFVFWTAQSTKVGPSQIYKTITLTLGKGTLVEIFSTQIADTSTLQQLGLSYRKSIGHNEAMLFVFPTLGHYQFWMKDMNFPIDIIWLNSDKKIIYIEQNLLPSTYPKSFGPTIDSQYVIEVASGTTLRLGIGLGDHISFSCGDHFCMK